MRPRSIRFTATSGAGKVSALLLKPPVARALLVLGHGAGAGMSHPFMETVAARLSDQGVATFRYQFPYMEAGRGGPNPPGVLMATVRAAVAAASEEAGRLPVLAGGKSLGGRMTSMAASEEPLEHVRGLVLFGFPLHAPGKPSAGRGEHLLKVTIPMLFLQGTRDKLADLKHLEPLCARLGRKASLHVVEEADHSFHVPKRAGRTDDEILEDLARVVGEWSAKVTGAPR